MFYWKPFKSRYSLYAAFFAEAIFAVVTLLLYTFVEPQSPSTSSTLGWVMISMVIAALACAWGCVILQQVHAWKRRKLHEQRKEAREKRKKEREGRKSARDAKKDSSIGLEAGEGETKTQNAIQEADAAATAKDPAPTQLPETTA